MPDNTLTLALEGDVPLSQFVTAMRHFHNLVDLLSREVAQGSEIEWVIEDLQSGSALATVVGITRESDAVSRVIRAYGTVGRSLQRHEPIPFSPGVAKEATLITKVLTGNITSVRFQTKEQDAIVYSATANEMKSADVLISFGTIKGKVQTITSRGNLKFTLYDEVFDKAISCYLDDKQEDLMAEIWGKHVYVTGNITRESSSGRPVAIRDITTIDPVIVIKPGSYKTARGIFSWSEGDEPAEISIRRVRDAED